MKLLTKLDGSAERREGGGHLIFNCLRKRLDAVNTLLRMASRTGLLEEDTHRPLNIGIARPFTVEKIIKHLTGEVELLPLVQSFSMIQIGRASCRERLQGTCTRV